MKAVDLFAGWGGFTLGAEQAGARVVWAANHWPLAVAAHAANHPGAEHVCQDLQQADWTALPRHELLLASPACQGHSAASQPRRRPHHDAMRATAWAVIGCAEVTEPRAVIVENVVGFRRWTLYPVWRLALERLGYTVSEHLVQATDYGVPQRRERLLVVATKGARVRMTVPALVREQPFESCLQLDAGGWRPLSAAQPGARARMLTTAARHGGRCLVQHVTRQAGVPLHEPIRTITTRAQWCLVEGSRYRWLSVRELARGMGFPDSYAWPPEASRRATVAGLGGAICPPVARAAVRAVMEAA